ncbi:MAG: GNAT family N-acetyltransferase [Candidatus Sumerlaeota bacterium]|nr:GNAT family N-acetyltransferase [Candidatus Sumerlaeota bacterium]
MLQNTRERYIGGSHYDWNASRIGVIGERVITHFGVWDYQMRIGSARVRCGGVGAVATHQDFRRHGLMDLTARASVEAMRALGYDMSVLFGIANFYHRYGYTRAWCPETTVVNLPSLPSEKPSVRIHKFAPRPRPDIAALYNREHRRVTGSAVRPTYQRGHFASPSEGYLWADGRGQPIGYVIVKRHPGFLEVFETAGDVEQSLRVVASLARRAPYPEVRFATLPYNTPLARRLRQGNCRVETRFQRNAGPLAATIRLAGALGKMVGELSQRLRRSPMAGWKGDLLIADAREKAILAIRDGRIQLAPSGNARDCIRGGDEIAQLLLGTEDPLDLAEAYGVRLKGQARALAPILFPRQHPILRRCDEM